MIAGVLSFSVNSSAEEDIRAHLLGCDQHFIPPLSERVDLIAYSRKVRDHALTIEAWDGKTLVGLVAGYLNTAERSSYVTNVSVLPSFAGKGIATKLLDTFIEHAKTASIETMALEVSKANPTAMHLFSKFETHAVEDRGDYLLMRAPLAGK
jgi:ribosomal protein S18 acetylase RimI-like enzyme